MTWLHLGFTRAFSSKLSPRTCHSKTTTELYRIRSSTLRPPSSFKIPRYLGAHTRLYENVPSENATCYARRERERERGGGQLLTSDVVENPGELIGELAAHAICRDGRRLLQTLGGVGALRRHSPSARATRDVNGAGEKWICSVPLLFPALHSACSTLCFMALLPAAHCES